MQNIIEDLKTWQKSNNMHFKISKSQVLQFGKYENLKNDYVYVSPDSSDLIIPHENIRDLGVIINNNLEYSDHKDKICKEARQRINLLLRDFNLRTSEFMKFVWRTYIQPILKYCSQAWCQLEGRLLLKLELLL